MKAKLMKPSIDLRESYIDYIAKWESTKEYIIPYASRRNGMSYKELLKSWRDGETIKAYTKGLVPATLYFLVDENNIILGALHFRHKLNEKLLSDGGHIGLGIRPSERSKGYGTILLQRFLTLIRKKEYHRILVTCDYDNIASARIIEKNGGILENIVVVDENQVKRYWINL